MGKWYEEISEDHVKFLLEQHVFFVATAAPRGYVNVSPKGHAKETFTVLDGRTVAYLDMTGSGTETFAHSKVDGRITVLFVAITGPPKILRCHGTCRCILREDVKPKVLAKFAPEFINHKGFRAVVMVDVERVSTSCGYSMPLLDYAGQRPTLFDCFEKKTMQEVDDYHVLKNTFSIDRLPGIGHWQNKQGRRAVAARLTDGSKPTPGARDGFWWGYQDVTTVEALRSWLPACNHLTAGLSLRDLSMLFVGVAVGATSTFTALSMRQRSLALH